MKAINKMTNTKTRSEKTKHALIMAGIDLFGEYGFNGTTTRMLSEKSGANISAIPYYFTNKEGLYLAVIDYITDKMSEFISEAAIKIESSIKTGEITKDTARENLKILVNVLTNIFVQSEEVKKWALIIMREQLKPTKAFDKLYNKIMKRMHTTACFLIAICLDAKQDDEEIIFRTHSFLGQILVFLFSRELLLRRLDVKSLTDKHSKTIYKVLEENIERCLNF